MTEESLPGDEDAVASTLAPVFAEMREIFLVSPPADVAERHLAAMFAAIAEPAAVADARVVPMRSRRRWIAGVAAVGALGLTTGLAAAGELPSPLQRRVAGAVANVGIHVPTGSDEAPATTPSTGPKIDDPAGTNGNPQNDGNGQSEDAPGHGGVAPGQSEDAPGRGGNAPGQSENAPGQGGTDPGNSGDAPKTSTTKVKDDNEGDDGDHESTSTTVTPSSTTPPTTKHEPSPPTTVHGQGSGNK